MKFETTTDQASIVLLGAFNPKIFHPTWLALHDLISPEQADDAEINIVHTDITQFAAAYMSFEIHTSRFLVRCDTIHKDVISDLVLTAFRDHLPHTPVWSVGINRKISYSCGSESARNELGIRLAPRGPWGSWGQEIDRSVGDEASHGGMMRLVMRQQPRPDGLAGHIQAELRPDPTEGSRVVVDINNHFKIGTAEETIGCHDAMEVLIERWQPSMENAEYIVDGLMATSESMK